MKGLSLIGAIVFVFAMGCVSVWAMGRHPTVEVKPKFSAWLTYWDGPRAPAALLAHASRLEEVELFAYHFAADDRLVPARANLKDLRDSFRRLPGKKPRVAFTIVNDLERDGGIQLKDPACVHRVVSSPEARGMHIQEILDIAREVDSIDIDYERVAAEDGPAYTIFIQALAEALHKEGKRLSVVVEPRVSDGISSDPLSNASSSLSWSDLAQAADQVTVMAYLYHYGGSGPGSIAPRGWVKQIAEYAESKVPREKLSIALHLGGFDWPASGAGHALEFDKATALATAYSASIVLDPVTQSGHFSYTDGMGVHEVWIETAAGLKAKVDDLAQMGVAHLAFWRLATGDPVFWTDLNKN